MLDCAQSAPHTPVDVKKLDVDFAATAAEEFRAVRQHRAPPHLLFIIFYLLFAIDNI
ncbi:aminotransferase class V-fold PLP-dependent enzyme [Gemmiger formicilis]|uniref:aminotransferase class V-fold PLP-dependent enzyme n=1 Tax=Gemmiger formicilis TaxID=745368 RepID=UPI003CCB2E08